MTNQILSSPATSITRAASKQTYYTIRFLVDRDRMDSALLNWNRTSDHPTAMRAIRTCTSWGPGRIPTPGSQAP